MINGSFLINTMLAWFVMMNLGCATVILDNKEVMEPPNPDPVRFENPVL